MNYETVYEAHRTFPLLGIFVIIIGLLLTGLVVFIFHASFSQPVRTKMYVTYIVGSMFGICALVFLVVGVNTLILQLGTSNDVYSEYLRGNYKVTSGKIEQFHAMPLAEHDTEHFVVNDIYFEYPEVTGYGYSYCKKDGGYITGDGETVRISYIHYDGPGSSGGENVILKLEIANR